MGEILAALPLARELRSLRGTLVCYFPLDIPWTVQRYLERLQPHLVNTLESEIWPNFLNLAGSRGILLVQANARISDQSFRRYIRYRRYVPELINNYDLIVAGTRQDYQHLLALGLDPAKVRLSGNLKCDRRLQDRDEGEAAEFQRLLMGGRAVSGSGAVWLAASTYPGEEEIVLAAYKELLGPYPSLLLVLSPMHPERAPGLAEDLVRGRHGLPYHLWSRLRSGLEVRTHQVVLIDTAGLLAKTLRDPTDRPSGQPMVYPCLAANRLAGGFI